MGAAGHGSSTAGGGATSAKGSGSKTVAAPLTASLPPDDLSDFGGTSQASTIHNFGSDQEITPPNEDVAAGPTDIVEVVNSTIYVFSRTGADLGSADLNIFMDVADGYYSSDPRVIYDASAGRFWITVTEVPDEYQSPSDCPQSAPVLIAVSGNSNPLPFSGWTVYGLPMKTFGSGTGQPLTEFGDQPGLGISTNTVTVTFDDYTCDNVFNGSEIEVLQKSDFETDSGNSSLEYFYDGPFAPQPVQGLGAMSLTYIVSNQSDCLGNGCLNGSPDALIQAFTGTPEGAGGVTNQPFVYIPMTATAVDELDGVPASGRSAEPRATTADQRRPIPQRGVSERRDLDSRWHQLPAFRRYGAEGLPRLC